ncbi:MAG: dethiobiotin synthase [Prevotellaceae bacterium]|jgi:dethiobiotin synthetase|nr:dethiobiotin synthase [Prevotellaceae bacterium]
MGQAIFVTGIDTNIGKSYATGYLAKKYAKEGYTVITQKLVQTGNSGISEDIEIHRKIMGTGLLPEDLDGTTCPLVLSYPASPHLAARIDDVRIDIAKIQNATNILKAKYDMTLIEGVGGIMSPLTEGYTALDYVRDEKLPVIVVTSPRLGSINHTLLTLEICRYEKIKLIGVVYNKFRTKDRVICEDTAEYLQNYLRGNFTRIMWMEIRNKTVRSWILE